MKRAIRLTIATAAIIFLVVLPGQAAHLSAPARQAFDQYVVTQEERLTRQHSKPDTYLAVFSTDPASAMEQMKAGALLVQSVSGGAMEVPGGLIHHWRGAAFVSGAKPEDMLALLQDYDGLARHYAPEVESSRALSERNGAAKVVMRLKQQQVVTVVLDTEYDVQTHMSGTNRGYSISRSTHIQEVEAAGTAHERHLPEGEDDGFLWRLNSYWSFVELPGGLLIECEAVSLTRDIPGGLSWLAAPIVELLPRQSLEFTLKATRNALASNAVKEIHL